MRWTALFVLALALGCAKPAAQPAEVYRVVSHDAASGEWVLDRVDNLEHTRVRFTLTCVLYKLGSKQPVEGNTTCDLVVGETLLPKRLTQDESEFLDVWQTGDTMFITKGKGENRVHQQFTIKSAKVIERMGGD